MPGRAAIVMLSSSVLLFSIVQVTAVHLEAAGFGGRGRLGATGQRAAREHQVDVADRDGIAVAQHRRVDAGAVDERAVDAAVVPDLGSAGRGQQGRVMTRREDVGHDDVVIGCAADLDGARGARCDGLARPQDLQHARREVALGRTWGRGRAHRSHRLECRLRYRLRYRGLPHAAPRAIRLPGRCARPVAAPTGTAVVAARTGIRVGPFSDAARSPGASAAATPVAGTGGAGARPLRGPGGVASALRADRHRLGRRPTRGALVPADLESQLRSVGVADVEALTVVDVDRGHPPVVDVHPVEAAVVDGDPAALVEPQHKVCAGDQRMCDTDVGAKVTADNYVVARREASGRPVVSNGQRGRGWSAHRDQL